MSSTVVTPSGTIGCFALAYTGGDTCNDNRASTIPGITARLLRAPPPQQLIVAAERHGGIDMGLPWQLTLEGKEAFVVSCRRLKND